MEKWAGLEARETELVVGVMRGGNTIRRYQEGFLANEVVDKAGDENKGGNRLNSQELH